MKVKMTSRENQGNPNKTIWPEKWMGTIKFAFLIEKKFVTGFQSYFHIGIIIGNIVIK